MTMKHVFLFSENRLQNRGARYTGVNMVHMEFSDCMIVRNGCGTVY